MLAAIRQLQAEGPDELGLTVSMRKAPPVPFWQPDHYLEPAILVIATWAGDPAAGATALAPLRAIDGQVADLLQPASYMSDEGQNGLEAAYGAATLERLVALKDRFDPTNVFRFDTNIPPNTD